MSFKPKPSRPDSRPPRISDAEWSVMRVLWKAQAATARQVVEALQPHTDWKPKTIHTLLSRLVQKGALNSERVGREYLFRPALAEQDCVLAASRSFLERVFDGEIAPLLACFVKRERLSRKQIDELKRILDGKEPR